MRPFSQISADQLLDFSRTARKSARAAADFAQKLSEPGVLPPEETDPNDEWPAYPYIQFQLDETEASRLRKAQGQKRAKLAMQVIPDKCLVAKADTYAERLFGVPSFRAGTTLKKLKSDVARQISKGELDLGCMTLPRKF